MKYEFPVTRTKNPKKRPEDETKLGFAKYFTDHMFVMDYDEGQGWHDGRVVPHEPILIEPASCVLHYAQMMFEGMKAYRRPDGTIQLFRPDMNVKRMKSTCERMCMPYLPDDLLCAAVEAVIKEDADWIPTAPGTALYIRPFLFGDEVSFSVLPAKHYRFMIILSPTGSYYAANDGGLSATRIFVQDKYIRAAKGGTGYAKVGGNYGGGMRASQDAMKYDCKDVLWLDAAEHKYVEEIGTSNAFFMINDEVITASLDSGTILPGITRNSVIQLLKHFGIKVTEGKLSIDEIVEASKDGSLKEIFASGTAAVISPIGCLNYNGTDYTVNGGNVGPVAQKLYDTLYGIQTGTVEDFMGWTYPLDIKVEK
ncbi:MAG: branched-chain amino acid aminotransferase [Clostridia bacterium]|nr:branched-chain amino acid aminotransferase [Clostridia bacterium]